MKGQRYWIDAHEIDVGLDAVLEEPVSPNCGGRRYAETRVGKKGYNSLLAPIVFLATAGAGYTGPVILAATVVTYALATYAAIKEDMMASVVL